MNWKASLSGALLVAICGVAAGAAIGGRTTTKVRTVTVANTSSTSGTSQEQPTSPTTSSTETSTAPEETGTSSTPEPTAEGQQYLAEYLSGQDSQKLSQDASSVQLNDEPSKQELQGQTYQQAVVFEVSNYGSGNSASFQVPSPGFSRLTSKAVGLETVSNAETFYKLTVYKNNDSSPNSVVLYKATFHGPSEVHKMDFELQGATDLLFVWTKNSSEPDGQDIFIMADPVLTK